MAKLIKYAPPGVGIYIALYRYPDRPIDIYIHGPGLATHPSETLLIGIHSMISILYLWQVLGKV